ncbi:MAG: 3'(2'),5'-bisphosphate nucleotidase CysQ [Pseudomonadota bacterium]
MPLVPPSDDLDLIVDVAESASAIAMRYFRNESLVVNYKDNSSPVSEGDLAVDTFLRETLTKARPTYGWLSEETADVSPAARIAAPRTFIVDPIDGTRAYIGGLDTWCISIAVVEDGRPIAGVLHCPALNEVHSAFLGDNQQDPAIDEKTHKLMIGGSGALINKLTHLLPDHTLMESHYVPSLAYRIAMVADGRLAGTFIRQNAHEWDLAAADLIASNKGARLVDRSGQPIAYNSVNPKQGPLVCAAPALIGPMLDVVTGQTFR